MYCIIRISFPNKPSAHLSDTMARKLQYALEFISCARVEKQICTTEIALERVVRCTSSNESLVHRGVVRVPTKPVFAVRKVMGNIEGKKDIWWLPEMAVGSSFGCMRCQKLVHGKAKASRSGVKKCSGDSS